MEMQKNEIIDIPDFTEEDFLETTEPYAFLYRFYDDKFLLRQLVERMKRRAVREGVKGFLSLWRAYCEAMKSRKSVPVNNYTKFDGQPLELFSGSYICDNYGVYTLTKAGEERVVCLHPIMPVQRLVNIDTGEERLKIAYKKGECWREIVVEKTVISSKSAIIQLSAHGIVVNSENASDLSTFLLEIEHLNYDYIPEVKSTSRLGWIENEGFSPYVDNLYFDGENDFGNIFHAIKPKGSEKKWIDAMIDLRSTSVVGKIILASSFSSVLLSPCGLLPFFLHIWGKSGFGKSVGLMIAASVWGSPKRGDYIITFNSTDVGQEMTASFLNNLPMCMDELQIQAASGAKEFDRIIYKLTEGIGKTRGSKDGGVQSTKTWGNCFITNGERPISSPSSYSGALNRIIEIECTEKIYHDLIDMSEIIKENYGFAGKTFVEYLQKDGVLDAVKFIQKSYYKELLELESTSKQALSASAILTADEIATSLIFQDGNQLKVEDLAEIISKERENDENNKAYEYIIDLIVKNSNRFKTESNDPPGEIWGKIEGDYAYIVKQVFDKEMKDAGFSSRSFLSHFRKTGTVIADSDRLTKKTRIVGKSINSICLKIENI